MEERQKYGEIVKSAASFNNSSIIGKCREFQVKGRDGALISDRIDAMNHEVAAIVRDHTQPSEVDVDADGFDAAAIVNRGIQEVEDSALMLSLSLPYIKTKGEILAAARDAFDDLLPVLKEELQAAAKSVEGHLRKAGYTERCCPINGDRSEGKHCENRFSFLVRNSPLVVARQRSLDAAKEAAMSCRVAIRRLPDKREELKAAIQKLSEKKILVA